MRSVRDGGIWRGRGVNPDTLAPLRWRVRRDRNALSFCVFPGLPGTTTHPGPRKPSAYTLTPLEALLGFHEDAEKKISCDDSGWSGVTFFFPLLSLKKMRGQGCKGVSARGPTRLTRRPQGNERTSLGAHYSAERGGSHLSRLRSSPSARTPTIGIPRLPR